MLRLLGNEDWQAALNTRYMRRVVFGEIGTRWIPDEPMLAAAFRVLLPDEQID